MRVGEGFHVIRFRYLVNDVDEAVAFYTSNFDFRLEQQFGPAIALMEKDGVRVVFSGPMASAGQAMPDGSVPESGGWNRILISVDDIEAAVSRLKGNGVEFKNEILEGPGGKQILCVDPSGNVVEVREDV